MARESRCPTCKSSEPKRRLLARCVCDPNTDMHDHECFCSDSWHKPAPAQPLNPHGWTDQPNYRYPCCLGSPQEGHKEHCEAASQPVEDPRAKCMHCGAGIHTTNRTACGWEHDNGDVMCRATDATPEAALSSVEDSAPTAKERTLLIDRMAIDAELIKLRAELERAKDALTYLRRDLDVAVKEKLRVERLLSEARKESGK